MTNATGSNEVVVFSRAADGTLTPAGTFPTGGQGTGAGLGTQGVLRLVQNRLLFVSNAGTDDISVFAVNSTGLKLTNRFASGGARPVSLTVHGRLLYALNDGGNGNIAGFYINRNGKASPIPNSIRPLSGNATGPAQIEFSPDGRYLVVTEKNTNQIDIYAVNGNGVASGPTTFASSGQTPFGFSFDHSGLLVVSEAFGGGLNLSAVSSYQITADGNLQVISGSVGTNQTAACWIAITENDKFAYATNTGSGSITGYRISRNGNLSLLDADGRTGVTSGSPIDMALSSGSRFLYALSRGNDQVSGFRVGRDGSLAPIGSVGGLAASVNGLAAK
jgi:6-phosphogluconolactonase (cycloisomerase 2 family)